MDTYTSGGPPEVYVSICPEVYVSICQGPFRRSICQGPLVRSSPDQYRVQRLGLPV